MSWSSCVHPAAASARRAGFADEEELAAWLARDVCPVELAEDRLREALAARCRAERLEAPAPSRIDRMLGAGRAACEQQFCARTVSRLSPTAVGRLEEMAAEADAAGMAAVAVGGGRRLLAELNGTTTCALCLTSP